MIRKTIIYITSAVIVAACSPPGNGTANIENVAPGWVRVNFNEGQVYDRKNSINIDEVVGPLIADGIQVNKLHWFKPLYGNQNLLWFESESMLASNMHEQMRNKSKQAAPPWTISEIADDHWHGMTVSPVNNDFSINFNTCTAKQVSIVVLFWGTEAKRFEQDKNTFLQDLVSRCQ